MMRFTFLLTALAMLASGIVSWGLGPTPELLPTSDPTYAPTQTLTPTPTSTFASPLAPTLPLSPPLGWKDVMTHIWDFAKAIVAGVVGAYLVHFLDYKRFRKEEKYRDEQKKRDALVEILGRQQSMKEILKVASHKKDDQGWQREQTETWKSIDRVRPLFQSNEKVSDALNGLVQLFRFEIVLEDAHPCPHKMTYDFDKYIEVLKNELTTLEESLS